MIRNLKALGLALVALFAMSALTASAASANNDVFTVSGGGSALLTGVSHDNKFAVGGVSFECTTAKFAATVLNNDASATVEPLYAGTKNVVPHTTHCTSSIGSVTVNMDGCAYILTGSTTGADNGTDATIWIECPAGKEITIISTTGAVIEVPEQTPTSGGVTYTNEANHPGGASVKVKATSTGITYTCAPAFTCALGGLSSEGNNATYTGTVIATGWEDKEGLPTPVDEGGNRRAISVSTKP